MNNPNRQKLLKLLAIIFIIFLIIAILIITNNTFAYNENKVSYKTQNIDDSDELNTVKISENEAIVIYSKSDWFSILNAKGNAINKFTESEIMNIESEDIEEYGCVDNIKTEEGDIKISLIKSDKYSTEELIDLLKGQPYVKSVFPNYIFPVQSLTNDPYLQYQYALEAIEGNGWNADADINPMTTYSDKEKVIAIIDTGVNYAGSEIEDVLWTNPYDESIIPGTHGYNIFNHNTDLTDDYGHGTHIVSILGAKANDNKGMAGSLLDTPNVKIMMLKAGNKSGVSLAAVLEAYSYIYLVQAQGTKVVSVNNSWGTFIPKNSFDEASEAFKPLIDMVGEKGAVTVFAAGNNGKKIDETGKASIYAKQSDGTYAYEDQYCFPVAIDSDYTISVGATDENGNFAAGFSNHGPLIEISAPGANIFGLQISDGFTSSLLSEEEREEYCEVFYDFNDGDLSLFDGEQPENVVISATDDMFYGKEGKSVKIEVNDVASGQKVRIPIDVSCIGEQLTANRYMDLQIRGKPRKDVPSNVGGDDYVVRACLSDGTNVLNAIIVPNRNTWKSWVSASTINEYFINRFNTTVAANVTGYLEFEAYKTGSFEFYVDDFAISKPIDQFDAELKKNYYESSGTSFSAPYVTAAIATMSNLYEDYDARQLKQALLDNAIVKERLKDYCPEGRMLNVYKLFGTTTITEDIVEITNQDVTISIDCDNKNMGVKVQYKIDDGNWLDYEEPFILTQNATIYTRVADETDTLECQSLSISNIDKTPPTITGVEEKTYQADEEFPIPLISDNVEIYSIILTKDGTIIDNYVSGTEISEPGSYELKAIDTAQNEISVNFTIMKKELINISITVPSEKTEYIEGEDFDGNGMIVVAYYNDGSSKELIFIIITDGRNLALNQEFVTISYVEDGITQMAIQPITVTKKKELQININEYETIEEEGINLIEKIPPNTTIEKVKNNIETNGTIEIYYQDTQILDDSISICTGMGIRIKFENSEKRYTTVVRGDADGDGKSDLFDILMMNKHRLGKEFLQGVYLKASDLNKDIKIDIGDILETNKYRLGKLK